MRIKKSGNKYKVESSKKGKFYDVDPDKPSCTCLHYKMRMAKIGGACKHIKAVREKVGKKQMKKGKGIVEFVQKNKEVDSVKLIEKFGEKVVDDMIQNGELIEFKGKIRLMV